MKSSPPLRVKGVRASISAMLMLGCFGLAWFFGDPAVADPPGRNPWNDAAVFGLLLAAPRMAARFWYWWPMGFAYGVFSVIPAAMYHLGPLALRGHLVWDPEHAEYAIAAACCGAGLLSAFVGYYSTCGKGTATRRGR